MGARTKCFLWALGIRINVSGRLGGADIARTEWYVKAACRYTHCVPILITVLPSIDNIRYRCEGLVVQR